MAEPPSLRPIFYASAADGWRLSLEYIAPPEPERARGALWCGHAMMVSRKSLDRPTGAGMGSTLAAAGYHVYLADLRGHGDSGPRAAQGGRWSYDDIVLQDVPALTAFVKERHAKLPLAVVGHSLTGHATLAALGQIGGLPIDAVVSLASNTWVRELEPSALRWAQKRLWLVPFVALARLRGYFPARATRFGSDDEARPYVEQFAQWAQSGRWGSADGARDFLAGLARVRCPVLNVSGAGDTLMCPPADAARLHARLTGAPVTSWVVSKGSRFGYDATHMSLVTSRRGKPLWREIARWLGENLPALETLR